MVQEINEVTKKRLEQFCIECNDFMKENFKPEPDELLTQYRYCEPVKCDRKQILVKLDNEESIYDNPGLSNIYKPTDQDILKVIKEIIKR